MPYIIAIDPGNEQSAFVLWDGSKIHEKGILFNHEVRQWLWGHCNTLRREWPIDTSFYCEMVACYGMSVGATVFDTAVWIGRFVEIWETTTTVNANLVKRMEVKMHHCHSAKAKDGNIRQALIDKYGPVGSKRKPNPNTGWLHDDLWSAFAIATYATEPKLR